MSYERSSYNEARMRTVTSKVSSQMNMLKRLLETPEGNMGTYHEGGSLNGSALSRTFISHKKGLVNRDRYNVSFSQPKESVSVSIVLDISASMSAPITLRGSAQERALAKVGANPSVMSEVAYSAIALLDGLDRSGIPCALALVEPSNIGYGSVNPRAIMVKDFNTRITDEKKKKLVDLNPYTGTNLTEYAWVALDLLEGRDETHRIAIFMTDMGDSGSRGKLHSMSKQALFKGITLAGVGMDSTNNPYNERDYKNILPNCLYAYSAESFSGGIIPFLCEAVSTGRQNY